MAATVVESAKVEEDAVLHLRPREDDSAGELDSRFDVVCTTKPPEIDMAMHAENRAKVLAYLREHYDIPANTHILMQGGPTPTFFDTDHEPLFRQESNFHYLFGVKEPDFFGTIDVETGRATLYCPRLPEEYAVWMGDILSCEDFKKMYQVDEVKYADELKTTLETAGAETLLRVHGVNTDSGIAAKAATFEGVEDFTTPTDVRLSTALIESRVVKSKREIEVMRYMNHLSSEAHMAVMRSLKCGLKEYQMESVFRHWCYYHGGARHMSYTCICAAGGNGSTLHYGHAGAPNSKTIEETDMCLFDMGGEYHRYGSDITCSFPARGTFSEQQKIVYNAVLDATWSVEKAMKEGVQWVDMHDLSYRVILRHLAEAGLLTGTVDEMMEVNMGAVFMPHGLGHFLGIDTHDCGGYPEGAVRDKRAGYKSLRCNRELKAGMVITVEPGCYFGEYNMKKALANPEQARFINKEMLDTFKGFGGVRIEDNVLVLKTHVDVLTHVPRTVEDVEDVLAGRKRARADLYKPDFTPKPAAAE